MPRQAHPPPLRLEAVYRETLEFAWRSLISLGVPPADVEDVAQEVYVTVRSKLATYDPERSLRGWLYGFCRNAARHHHRSRTRAARRLAAVPSAEEGPTPEDVIARREAADELAGFLQTLDEAKREVFVLSFIEGLSSVEIAQATETKINTVYTRLRTARLAFERHARQRLVQEAS